MRWNKSKKHSLESKINSFLDRCYESFKVQYVYAFFGILWLLLTLYHIVIFIVNLGFYSYIGFIVFAGVICLVAYLYQSKKYHFFIDLAKNQVQNYGVLYFIAGVAFVFITNMFMYSTRDYVEYFLYSLCGFFAYYLVLRKLGLKTDFSIVSNDILSDDIMTFYTIFIYCFFFFLSYFFALGYITFSRELTVLVSFFLVSLVYLYFFHIYKKTIDDVVSLKSKAFGYAYSKTARIVFLIALSGSVGWFYYDMKTSLPEEFIDQNMQVISNKKPNVLSQVIFINETPQEYEDSERVENIENIDSGSGDVFNEIIISYKKISQIYDFKRYLGRGNTGDDVDILQKILIDEGILDQASGIFDLQTSQALQEFITLKTGIEGNYSQLGPKTLQKLNDIEIKVP